MTEPDDFEFLQRRFEREHQHVAAEPFVASTLRRVHRERMRLARLRNALRVALLVAAVVAAPWLISGAAYLNARLDSSLRWTAQLPGAWLLGVLAIAMVLVSRRRSR